MRIITLKTPLLFLLGLGLTFSSANAQAIKLSIDDPEFDDLPSPEFGGNTDEKKTDPKDWLEVEVKLNVDAVRPEPKDGYIDRLEIRWYVAVEDPASRGYFLLEKDVTYLNIPIKEEQYASVYLAPSAIRRLTGSDRAGKGSIWGVAGEVLFNGTKVAVFSSKSEKEWWKSSSLSRTDKIPLLSKGDTPFKFLWWDRYLQEEPSRR